MRTLRSLAVMPNTSRRNDAAPYHAGHLSVRPDDEPGEAHFLFEVRETRMGGAIGVSVMAHGAAFISVILLMRMMPEASPKALLPERLPSEIVWIVEPGLGGGGGGGGNQMEALPKKVELPGTDAITVPTVAVAAPEVADVSEELAPVETLNIPAMTMAAAATTAPGVLEASNPSWSLSQGSGSGGGSGTGTGSGIGAGLDSGLGEGFGGGIGGGAYRPGNGVETPRLLRDVKPKYTAGAMRAKIQGVVVLECIVLPDGTVGDVQVKRSLDRTFGLDEEAVKAARQWQFSPGTRLGQSVAVIVSIELSFSLR